MEKPTVSDIMIAYSEDAVDMASKTFGKTLDFSEESLKEVEYILDNICKTIPHGFSALIKKKPSNEQIEKMSKIWGGYLGEVIRRKWGGTWVTETAAHPGSVLTLKVMESDIFPPAKVYKRITNGSEDNVWIYYQVLKQDFSNSKDSHK